MLTDKMELYKIRTFSELLTDTFAFTKRNFKPLLSGLFYIVSPALLASVVFGFFLWSKYFGFYQTMIMPGQDSYNAGKELVTNVFFYMIPTCFFLYISFSLIIAVTFSYIKLYANNQDRKPTVSELWQLSRKYIWKILGAQLFLFFIFVMAYTVCIIPLFAGSIGVFLAVILFFAFLFLIIFYSIKLSFFSLFIVIEDEGIMQSFSLSYQFTKGIFWKTLGFMFVLGLIVGIASNILQLPGMLISSGAVISGLVRQSDGDNSFLILLGSALTAVGMAIAYLLYSVVFIGQSLLYFSEMEQEYGIAANQEIEEIGKN